MLELADVERTDLTTPEFTDEEPTDRQIQKMSEAECTGQEKRGVDHEKLTGPC